MKLFYRRALLQKTFAPLLLTAGLSFSCSDIVEIERGPSVVGMAKDNLVVGETMILYAQNIKALEYQNTFVEFKGTYIDDLGKQTPVDLRLKPLIDGPTQYMGKDVVQLRINRMGPFKNPFSVDDRPGYFQGSITAIVEDDNGDLFVDIEPQSFNLTVAPSLLITELQPIGAKCSAPALRALENLAYRMRVKASGIQATKFVYKLNFINGREDIQTFEHNFDTPVEEDILGLDESIIFNRIPAELQSLISSIRVEAYDQDGRVVETALPISIHRPMEVNYDGKRQIAQRYEPQPVSGCIPGGIGTNVSYSEAKSETRQKTVSMTISQSWERSQGSEVSEELAQGISTGYTSTSALSTTVTEESQVSQTTGTEYTTEQTNEFNSSTTTGEEWGFNYSQEFATEQSRARNSETSMSATDTWAGGAEVGVKIPIATAVTGKLGVSGDVSRGTTAGSSVGTSEGSSSGTSTESGYSTSGSRDTTRSFGSSTTNGQSRSVDNTYALGTSTSQSVSEEQSLSSDRVWDLRQGTSLSQVAQEGEDIAKDLTVSTSKSTETVTSFSAFIPRGRYGVFYRQTTRWVKVAEVVSYNLCGLARHMGELQFNDYTWAPDLAIASNCEDRVPPPNLLEAGCLVGPCTQ